MSAADPLLDRAAIENAFRRLGERLARRGVVAVPGRARLVLDDVFDAL
ncbi:hypothetical protein [Plantactinospora endophytica]|nr:hypothetical protein [Plantactinospora endophytica]